MQSSQRNSQTPQTNPSTSPYYTQMNYARPQTQTNHSQPTKNSLAYLYAPPPLQRGSPFQSQSSQQRHLAPNHLYQSAQHNSAPNQFNQSAQNSLVPNQFNQSPQHNLAPNHLYHGNLLNSLAQPYVPSTLSSPSLIPSNVPSTLSSPSLIPSNTPSPGLSVQTNPFEVEETLKSKNAPRFERQDYLNLIEYLSTPRTYNSLFGAGKKTSVTGQTMQTSAAWNVFATHINYLYNERKKSSNFNRMELSGSDLRQRFRRYRLLYCRTKGRSGIGGTGSGTSDKDTASGINTLNQKLEDLCPCYHEMDELFGEKANVTAMDAWDSAIQNSNWNLDMDLDFDDEDGITCDDADDLQATEPMETDTPALISSNRTHTFADLLDNGHHQFPSAKKSQLVIQTPRLEIDLDGVFQPLQSSVDNLDILLQGPSTWDTVSGHSSPVRPDATLPTNEVVCLPSPNTVSTSDEVARTSSQALNPSLRSNTSSDQQQSQNIPKAPDQPAKRRTATKRQPKSQDKVQDSPNPLPPITAPPVTAPKTPTALPSKFESKNPLAHAFITITEAKAAQFEQANKREADFETRRLDYEEKRLKIQDDRLERELVLDRRKLAKEENKEKIDELRMTSELAWQKEKFQLESQERTQDKRVAQMNMWLKEGKSVADVKLLLEMSGLAQPAQPTQPTQPTQPK